ncbi:hypothetical protein BO94DRAFT_379082 [Aspergillus sclerotioniger CBS 115572]|uniref:Uncharacterized protein n=1 Tax=Aspergillus sclerotioniger CBS 115572 TaxID=1450535 RepID=A0A317X2C5_9EURO|nr:hypothetical protein BO94DRAFT_379082 [Aspergillus sclerotioniger CBS 115572]PWY91762.1 hypothetical protein BO94DRAFT_379082 [Aspergillus sclerotioniger CBS 115572]
MSSKRVIQDSDDEDDPLAGPPSPRPNADNTHVDVQKDAHYQAQQTGHDSHMSINFDQFLQSQESAHRGISSSQQRREERWIPGDVGGGSIGTMMTEIGLAQQRLFDDEEAHHVGHTGHQDAVAMEAAQTDSAPLHEQIASEFPAPNDIALINQGNLDNISEQPPLYADPQLNIPDQRLQYETGQDLPPADTTNLYTREPTEQNNQHTSSNYSVSTGASYNIYPTGIVQTEIAYKSPQRHNSVQPTPFSPHDTEPFSSVVSPKVSRSKSDNSAQQSHRSVDELAGPVTIEIPVVEKKQRGRKKKQSLPDNDDDDELAHHPSAAINQDATATTTTNNTNKPEKRKPGRPPKNAKPPRDEQDQTDSAPNNTTTIPVPPETTSTDPFATTEHDQTPILIDSPLQDTSQPSKNPPKEPKKKKLKRGKTTSLTLTKTYESDVEDDVIWIDERPLNPTTHDNQPDDNNNNSNADPPVQEETPPAPAAAAPKKRGRKRKITVEEHPIDPLPPTEPPLEPQPQSDKENALPAEPAPNPQAHPEAEPEPELEPHEHQQHEEEEQTPDTHQETTPTTPLKPTKGPTKHSPISSTSKVPYRVGLSRRARIAPLLKIVKR